MSGPQFRITRRRALAIGGSLVGSALAAACVPTQSAPGATAPGASAPGTPAPATGAGTAAASITPRRGGTLTYSRSSKLQSPTNVIASLLAADYFTAQNMYEPLYQFKDGAVVGLLAEKTDTSADGLTWTITLRSGVKFHDGTNFDATAVKTNLDVRKARPTFLARSAMAPMKEVKVVDPKTVQLILNAPSGSLQAVLASIAFGMQSPTAMAKYPDPADYAKNAAGTGVFKPEGGPTAEGGVTFVRNEEYWGQKANLDKLVYKPILDDGARSLALEAGDVQVAGVAPADAPRLRSDGKVNVLLALPAMQGGGTALWFNLAKPPFNDKRVRQAVAYGLDGDAMVKLFGELGKRADSVLSPGMLGYTSSPLYPYDVAKAKQLLADAGLKAGTPLDFIANTFGSYPTHAQLIKQNLDALGFNTTIRALQSAAWLPEMNQPAAGAKWQLSLDGIPSAFPDADALFPRYFASATDTATPGGGNWDHYRNDQFDALLAKQAATADQGARNAILAQMQRMLWDDLPMIPLVWISTPWATSKSVHDVDVGNLDGYPRYQRAWLG